MMTSITDRGEIMGLGDRDSAMFVVPVTLDPVTGLPTRQANAAGTSDTVLPSVTINAQNTVPGGAAPAGSAAPVGTNGRATAAFHITANTLNVALILQASLDGITWAPINGNIFVRQLDGALISSIPAGSTGIFTAAVADFEYVRLSTPNTALTGSSTVIAAASTTMTVVTMDNTTFAPANTAVNGAGIVLGASVDTLLLAANFARRSALIRNDSGQTVLVLRHTVFAACPYGHRHRAPTGLHRQRPWLLRGSRRRPRRACH
jgi:hypothetical protein